jgi:uncharacterized protein YggE
VKTQKIKRSRFFFKKKQTSRRAARLLPSLHLQLSAVVNISGGDSSPLPVQRHKGNNRKTTTAKATKTKQQPRPVK